MCTRERGDPAELPPLEYGVEIIECQGIDCSRSCVPEELDDDGFCEECSLQDLEDDDGYGPGADEGELGSTADPLT